MSSTPSQIDILIDKIIMKVFSMKSIRIITKIFESVSINQNVKMWLFLPISQRMWGWDSIHWSLVNVKICQPANYPGVQIIHSMSTTGFFTFCKRSARSFVQFHTCGCSGYYASADNLSQCVVYSICKYCLFYKSLHAVTFELCGDLIICHYVSILR